MDASFSWTLGSYLDAWETCLIFTNYFVNFSISSAFTKASWFTWHKASLVYANIFDTFSIFALNFCLMFFSSIVTIVISSSLFVINSYFLVVTLVYSSSFLLRTSLYKANLSLCSSIYFSTLDIIIIFLIFSTFS